MTVRVTRQLTGVDGKTCLDGKESNTESLTGTIKMRLTKVLNHFKSFHTPSELCSISKPTKGGSVKSVAPIIYFYKTARVGESKITWTLYVIWQILWSTLRINTERFFLSSCEI